MSAKDIQMNEKTIQMFDKIMEKHTKSFAIIADEVFLFYVHKMIYYVAILFRHRAPSSVASQNVNILFSLIFH